MVRGDSSFYDHSNFYDAGRGSARLVPSLISGDDRRILIGHYLIYLRFCMMVKLYILHGYL